MNPTKPLLVAGVVLALTDCALPPAKPAPPVKPLTARQACLQKRQEALQAALAAGDAEEGDVQDVFGGLGGYAPCPGKPGPGSHARYMAAQRVYYQCLKSTAVTVTGVQSLPYGAVPVSRASHDWAELRACMAAHGLQQP